MPNVTSWEVVLNDPPKITLVDEPMKGAVTMTGVAPGIVHLKVTAPVPFLVNPANIPTDHNQVEVRAGPAPTGCDVNITARNSTT